jgi:hypothetical protein
MPARMVPGGNAMPISISIDASGQFMVARFSGKVADGELRAAYEDFYRQHDVPLGFPKLCDLSAADLGGLTQRGLTSFAHWAQDLYHQRGETARKAAFILPGVLGRSKVIIYETLMQNSPEITRTFASRDDAVRWLVDPSPDSAVSVPTR